MANVHPIDHYKAHMYGHRQDSQIGAEIICLEGNTVRARLTFFRGMDKVPSNSIESGVIQLRYKMEEFPFAVDLLRNEEPVYVHYISDIHSGFLATHSEPVGEGEIQKLD